MTVGLDYAAGDAAVIDADRQDPADAEPKLISAAEFKPERDYIGVQVDFTRKGQQSLRPRGYLGALRRQDATSSSPHGSLPDVADRLAGVASIARIA